MILTASCIFGVESILSSEIRKLGYTIVDASAADTVVTFTASGTYTFTLTVTDSGVKSDTETITFYVGNVLVVDITPATIWENSVTGAAGTVVVADGSALPGDLSVTQRAPSSTRINVIHVAGSGVFAITLNDNPNVDGNITQDIQATGTGVTTGIGAITVMDDESPVITVKGNGVEIVNGSTNVSITDYTYFGTVVPGARSK